MENFKVGDIVRFTGSAKIVRILGDTATLRDASGKRFERKLHLLQDANEQQREMFYRKTNSAARHAGVPQ